MKFVKHSLGAVRDVVYLAWGWVVFALSGKTPASIPGDGPPVLSNRRQVERPDVADNLNCAPGLSIAGKQRRSWRSR